LGGHGRGADDVEGSDTEKTGEGVGVSTKISMRERTNEKEKREKEGKGKNDERKTHRFGSKTPAALRTSAATGTVELTGLEMMRTKALGQKSAIP
jgi:hypothetical protein